jgi:hypothetical protein
MASFSTFSSVDLGLDSPEGRDNIEDGLCWFKHLPMANDGNTVMAVYVGPALSRPFHDDFVAPCSGSRCGTAGLHPCRNITHPSGVPSCGRCHHMAPRC